MRSPIPELPAEGEPGILAQAVDHALGVDVLPSVQGGFSRSRLADAQRMIACIDRLRRYETVISELERDALAELLGSRPETVADGLATVDAGIKAGRFSDEEVLPYLSGRYRRLEWLYAPACAMFPDRKWAQLN